jgi:hypothetical protein
VEEKLKFVGAYLTQELYQKFRLKCFKKEVSLSKELLALIMVDCKNIKLEVKDESEKSSTT